MPEEEYIPPALVHEAEFALAREQLKTQTPELPPGLLDALPPEEMRELQPAPNQDPMATRQAAHGQPADASKAVAGAERAPVEEIGADSRLAEGSGRSPNLPEGSGRSPNLPEGSGRSPNLPHNWPDPRGFIPPRPSPDKPVCKPHYGPIISQVRQYDGADGKFTEALAGYFSFRDDARFGGWQSYLQRKDDFYRFCCYLHITEMLAARGGVDETQVAFRWPFGRYQD
jgi:hypothetical protein